MAMRGLIGVACVMLAVIVGGDGQAFAQTASPDASSAIGSCAVAPRSEEDLARLGALAAERGTPTAGGTETVGGLPLDGAPVDPETLRAVGATLAEVAACEASGDVARLFALYTDAYIVRDALAAEPVPILPGEVGTPVAVARGTPEVRAAPPLVTDSAMLPDGRVAARVERDGRAEFVVFAEVDGVWRVDETVAIEVGDGTPIGSPESVTDDPLGLAPVRAAMTDAAAIGGVDAGDVTVVAVEPVVWPDASLGCPEPGMFYAQVETAGYRVVLVVGGTEVTYHTDSAQGVVRCEGSE